MSRVAVLDSSAVLALLNEETGASLVRSVIVGSVISTVTLAELHSVLSQKGPDELHALDEILFILEEVVPFSVAQARVAGGMRARTKPLGLSLGDRACLALALELDADVYTADHVWSQVKVGVLIHLIR